MVSGIQWIPNYNLFMLNFNKIINFTSSNQVHLGTMNLIEKLEIVMNKMFLLFGVGNHNRTML